MDMGMGISYRKWDSPESVELSLPEASGAGRGGKALCLPDSAQGKAIAILYVQQMLCFVGFTALVAVLLGNLSQGLTDAQLDRDMIRRDAQRNLSHLQHCLELKMSEEHGRLRSQLRNVSQGLADAQLDREMIRRDAQRNLSDLQHHLELKMSEEHGRLSSQLRNVSQGLANAQLDREMIRRDAQRNLSDLQHQLELKMSEEHGRLSSQLRNVSKGLANAQLDREMIRRDAQRNLSDLQHQLDSKMSKELSGLRSQLLNEIRNQTHSLSQELVETRQDHGRLKEALREVQEELQRVKGLACAKCPSGWKVFEKHSYCFSTESKNWEDAKQACIDLASQLVIVNTNREQEFLKGNITKPHVYWLGLSDLATEGEWRWLDGSPLSTSFWKPGEPNNDKPRSTEEDCGSMLPNGEWNDDRCSQMNWWICERPC